MNAAGHWLAPPLAGSIPMRVLIAPDKFKGTLTAREAAEAIAAGWRQARPADTLELLPISDGGDGFGELLAEHLDARPVRVDTVDAAHRPIAAEWWWNPKSRLAIVEAARVVGLAMLPPGRFHPFELDTFGLGVVLRAVKAHGARQTIVGLGGSATNDAGFGLARALGWRFLDAAGREIERWPDLVRLHRLVGYSIVPFLSDCLIAVDVTNPLLGPRGATRVFGPQKGLRPADLRPAERALKRLAEVVAQRDAYGGSAKQPGAGAAGGLGFGLISFVCGALESGFELFAELAELDSRIAAADLVVTGEGAIDATTLKMGKGVGQLARRCRRLRRPCLGLAGTVTVDATPRSGFVKLAGMAPGLTSAEEAKARPAFWLTALARSMAASLERAGGTPAG